MLAILALRANHTVSADELIDGLWGERPPASAAKNVQLYVSRLRRVLRDGDSEAEIVTRGRGYLLQLSPDALDAARFERLVEQASREAAREDANGTAQAALALWGGAPLADVAEEPFAAAEVRRLEELHLRAIELAIDAELAAGHHAEVIGWLEALIAAHPWQERFYAQAMLALYRAGRQSEALELYRQAREVLVEEIGTEPGAELRELHEALLQHDPALEAPQAKEEPPPQLEGGSPILAGRERELRWLRELWDQAAGGRTVLGMLAGPPGIGKTRLAAELATEVQNAGAVVIYADGGGAPDPALQAVTRARLSMRPTLLVLDDSDEASPSVVDATVRLAGEEEKARSLLILVLHHTEHGPPAFAALLEPGSVRRLRLDPLSTEASAEIAELYASAADVAMPPDMLMAESVGVPLEVHRAASRWAQARATERLEVTASRTEVERSDLRSAEAELVGSVGELQVARERTDRSEPSMPDVCPFRGLAPFDAAHADYFFGRERLVAGLVASVVGSSLLSVVGPSGSGKSSVVRAGLLPALSRGLLPGSERWRQALMRPGEHPVKELRRTLARVMPGEAAQDGRDPLPAVLDSVAPGERLVLAVDQLEEMFTSCRDEGERTEFGEALVAAADDLDKRVVVVLAIRADFYGRCAEHSALSKKISDNHALVGPMSREELRRAIELPARKAGLRVEPPLVSALLDDVADEAGGLPLLSTTLLELWEERSGRTLRFAAYEASGGVSGAVGRLAERAYQRLSEPQRERARVILLRLGDAEEEALVRRRVPLEEFDVETDEEAAGALAGLTESRLVTVDEGTAEVAHEALLREWPRLREWLEEDAEGRRLHQHLIHAAVEWQASDRDPAELYRSARLAAALDWGEGHDRELNELERGFLEESRVASERETERRQRTNRRLKALLAGVGVLLALAVVAGVIALSQGGAARQEALSADAERLGAQALNEDRLDQALRLATAGIALEDTTVTRSNLLSALMSGSPATLGVLDLGTYPSESGIAISPDGSRLAIGDRTGALYLFDTETRELIAKHRTPGNVWGIAFAPDGVSLALSITVLPASDRGRLEILDAETGRLREAIPLGGYPKAPSDEEFPHYNSVTYTPDGETLIATYNRGTYDWSAPIFMRRFDVRHGAPLGRAVRVTPRSTSTNPKMTPDGRLIVTSDRATYALDAETLDLVRRYPEGGRASAISPDGRTLAVQADDGSLRIVDLASGHAGTLAEGLGRGIEGGAFSPDGHTLSWEDGEDVVLWDWKRGVETETLKGHAVKPSSQIFGPDGRTLYTASPDATAIIWDIAGDRRLGRPFSTSLSQSCALEPAFEVSPDGRTAAIGTRDGRVDLINAHTLRPIRSFEAFKRSPLIYDQLWQPCPTVAFSRNGDLLAVEGGIGAVGIWDVESGRRVGPLLRAQQTGWRDDIEALASGPGELLAAADVEGTVWIWDVDRRELLHRPLHLPGLVVGLEFSPDGSQLAIPFGAELEAPDGVEVRDVRSGERLARLRSPSDVHQVAFSPDGRLLAGSQPEGAIVLWDTDGWQQVGQPLTLGAGDIGTLDFSPDGGILATSYDDGTVVLLDVASRQTIGPALPGLPSTWTTARFTPDGDHLFAVSDKGPAVRWEVTVDAWIRHACAVGGGGLTPEQWEEIVPAQDYIEVCPSG